jgi:hypothetical protein
MLLFHFLLTPMRKFSFLLFFFSFFFFNESFSQDFIINQPRLEINGTNLVISYDIISNSKSDQYYVWIEIEKSNGEKIIAKSLSGDIGEFQKPGNNKRIEWVSLKDSVSIDDEIFITVKAEKYIKSFNRGSVLLKSTILPGWGQTKISGGKPWWLTGVAFYGVMAGGILYNQISLNSYDSYKIEENRDIRTNLLAQSQSQLKVSDGLFFSAAALWAANILWAAVSPEKYQPLKSARLSVSPAVSALNKGTLLSVRVVF